MLKTIADKHGRTPAQVALRYQLQRGVVALAKSFHEKRMRENLQVGSRAAGSRGRQGRAGPGPGQAIGVCPCVRGEAHASAVFNAATLCLLRGGGGGGQSSKPGSGWGLGGPGKLSLDSFSCEMKIG